MKKPAGCGRLRAVLVYSWQMDDFFYKALGVGCAALLAGSVMAGINWLERKISKLPGKFAYWISVDLNIAIQEARQEREKRRMYRQAGLEVLPPDKQD